MGTTPSPKRDHPNRSALDSCRTHPSAPNSYQTNVQLALHQSSALTSCQSHPSAPNLYQSNVQPALHQPLWQCWVWKPIPKGTVHEDTTLQSDWEVPSMQTIPQVVGGSNFDLS